MLLFCPGTGRSKGKGSFRAGGDADDFMEADDSDSSDGGREVEEEDDSDGDEQLPGVSEQAARRWLVELHSTVSHRTATQRTALCCAVPYRTAPHRTAPYRTNSCSLSGAERTGRYVLSNA